METKSKYEQHGSAVQNEVVIHRVFDLPVSKVWQALTEPEQFKKWWGPKGFTCPSSTMEAKSGWQIFELYAWARWKRILVNRCGKRIYTWKKVGCYR